MLASKELGDVEMDVRYHGLLVEIGLLECIFKLFLLLGRLELLS